jgi:hypothetical protein
MSSNQSFETLLIRFSNSRRKYLELQNLKTKNQRKSSLLEQYLFNLIPIVTSSSLLAPLNRLKIIMQVKKQIVINEQPKSIKEAYNSTILIF